MSDTPTWREATSQEEFIHDITEGVIQEFEDDEDFIEIFEGTEYDGVSEFYDQDTLYGNPFSNMVHFPPEQKLVPENTAEFLKQTDSLYEGVAKASKQGIDQLAAQMEKAWSELTPEMVCANLIAIVQTIADHIELKIGSMDVVFFNDPVHIRTLDPNF